MVLQSEMGPSPIGLDELCLESPEVEPVDVGSFEDLERRTHLGETLAERHFPPEMSRRRPVPTRGFTRHP
jgi:hypothetical protein